MKPKARQWGCKAMRDSSYPRSRNSQLDFRSHRSRRAHSHVGDAMTIVCKEVAVVYFPVVYFPLRSQWLSPNQGIHSELTLTLVLVGTWAKACM